MWDQRDSEPVAVNRNDRQAHTVEGYRSLGREIARQLEWNGDFQHFLRADAPAAANQPDRIDVALNDVTPEPVGRANRPIALRR